MYLFSELSKKRLDTCHSQLQVLAYSAIQFFNFSVLCGYRDKKAQNAAFLTGKSKVQYPNSMHNILPSLAFDLAPHPYDPKNLPRIRYFAGFIKGFAAAKGIKIISGIDWDNDTFFRDQTFNDMFHFQLEI